MIADKGNMMGEG